MDGIGAQRLPDGAYVQIFDAGLKESGTKVFRQVARFVLAAQTGDASGIFNLVLNSGHADSLIVEDHRQLIVDVGFGVTSEPLARVLRQVESRLPLAELALAGTRIAHLLPVN